jgi:hypothetical protein
MVEDHYCPRVDVKAQVLLVVVGERLIFVIGDRGTPPVITWETVQETRRQDTSVDLVQDANSGWCSGPGTWCVLVWARSRCIGSSGSWVEAVSGGSVLAPVNKP